MALTRRQKEVLDFIWDFVQQNGYSPSFHEIATGLELQSLATVHKHISILEKKGYLERGANRSRSIELSSKYLDASGRRPAAAAYEIPLAGRIAAGSPVEAFAQNDSLGFSDFLGDKGTYALQVRGDSMIDDHIMSGDYVLVARAGEAKDGDVVVALVDGAESTLKRFYREPNDMVRLQPANSEMQPIVVPAASVEIQGRVLAVLRKY
ncbi:MAG: transcriptional repressor LexA [Bryobacteraceae bacterium]|nr:transcriptional repressor LexA [Bryobacteraceae bacterium]